MIIIFEMQLRLISYLFLVLLLIPSLAFHLSQASPNEECRFAMGFTPKELLEDTNKLNSFLRQVIHWEAKFIRNVGLHNLTALTYDGYRLDVLSGDLLPGGLHSFTASSKESIHLGLLAKVLESAEFSDELYTIDEVFKIIELKTKTLESFNKKYPAFGGYLPWVFLNGSVPDPTPDFMNRVPALDNGQMFWGALALSVVWEQRYKDNFSQLRNRWDNITWKAMIANSRKIFFNETTKKIRAVADIQDMKKSVEANTYSNKDNYYLDDPYEGELYTWIITLFAKDQFTESEINNLWIDKRKKLQTVQYLASSLNTNITVEKGFWFSAHQQWKNLFMPYYLSPTYKTIRSNNEKARIWNSVDKKIPGLFASMSGPASSNTEDTGYFSDSGIESISFNKVTFNKLVTPYASFPLFLVNKQYGAVWLHNMLYSPCGQTKYGALEGTGLNGSLMSPVMTWDTKITTVLAIMNGTTSIIERYLTNKGLLSQFVNRLESQYKREFPIINGVNAPFAIPSNTVKVGRQDFTTCR